MTVVDGALGADDVSLLARMHVESLPESLVSLIGERYAREFYRYVAASPDELVLVERDPSGRLLGACILSLHPETLQRRLATQTPLALHAPFALGRLPLRKMLLGGGGGPKQPPGPEILLIFSLPSARSQGLGARLLARVEAILRARGLERLFVKTRDAHDNRAIQFYERNGFIRRASLTKQGKRLVLFDKPVDRRA